MANVLSMDLRVRFKTLMEDGLCAAAAGKTLLLSRATAARWGMKVRDGEPLEPLPSGPRKGSGKLEPFHPFFVEVDRVNSPDYHYWSSCRPVSFCLRMT